MNKTKVAVCTGSGRHGGLGEAILRRLGQEGYRLVVTDIHGTGDEHLSSESEMASVAEELRSVGTEVMCHPCDVRSPDSVNQKRGGIKNVIIPKDNQPDLQEIPDQIKDSLNIIPVEWVDEIVSLALEKEPLPLKKSNKPKKQKTIKSSSEKNQEKQTH